MKPEPRRAACFEDQYASTGGELYELIAGHDRFIADLRPLVKSASLPPPLCCHPYDLCTALIAVEDLGGEHTGPPGIGRAKNEVEPRVLADRDVRFEAEY